LRDGSLSVIPPATLADPAGYAQGPARVDRDEARGRQRAAGGDRHAGAGEHGIDLDPTDVTGVAVAPVWMMG